MKIRSKKYFGILASFIVALVLLGACKKTEEVVVPSEEQEKIYINNSTDQLNLRMTYPQEAVFSTKASKSDEDYYWYYVAEVAAPVFQGETLSATHVDIIDNKAYVSYNVQGNVYKGGIEVIDLSNPAYPTIITQMLFDGNDANAVVADRSGTEANRELYLALSSFKKGAVVRKIGTQNGQFLGDFSDLSLSKSLDGDVISASANGLACSDDYLYVTSGRSHGGVYQINKSAFSVVNVDEYEAAKYVVVNGVENGAKQVSLSTGDDAKLHVYDVASQMSAQTYDIGSIYHQNVELPYYGKSVIHIDEGSNECYVSMGMNGMKVFDINSGDELYRSPANMLTSGNTNGLSKDELFVYLANGADGLFIGQLPEGGGDLVPVQVWDMDESGASANLVKAQNDWIFVAKGGGGFKILRRIQETIIPPVCEYDSVGAPECIEQYAFCELLPEHLELTLPERVDAYENRPDYFLNQNHEIELEENANLSIVFISEGAGLKNSFGYYQYPTNNPPTSIDDIRSSMRIVFANASAQYSGGSLQAGDMVEIPQQFEEGTTVGFFLLANSWVDGEITEGTYQHFTRMEFNNNGLQQHLLMYDSICGAVTIGIEDIMSDRGDKDFNDLVFEVVIDPQTAFNYEEVIQIPPQ